MSTIYTEENLKYNFVFLFADCDYWRAILGNEIYEGKKSRVHKTAFEGGILLQKIFHYHWSYKFNKRIRVPFKKLWFKKMYTHRFDNDLPLCFIIMNANNIRFDAGFCDYIRKNDPRNKIVVFQDDLISKQCNYDTGEIKNKVDLVVAYDRDDALKYDVEYFQETTYSKLYDEPATPSYEYDVYLLAAAKDRIEKIHKAYRQLTSIGLKCKFVVVGVPREKQIEGIEYSDGIPYEESLRQISKARCVLEILQGGSSDITTRALEAIAYRKKFITDCPLDLTDFFNDKQLYQFKNIEEVDAAFIKEPFDVSDFEPKIDLNPLKRLHFIQDKLEIKDEH